MLLVILYVGSDFFNFLLGLLAFAQQFTFDVGGAESVYMFTRPHILRMCGLVVLGVKSLGCDSLNSLSAVDLAKDGTSLLKIKQEITATPSGCGLGE